ncbi:dockerin type I repeat-containing protein [Ruminococcus sp.]|uniref:dockerin type I repeat-containing protein n=1 Tax=Ruminococcus sp. TaxID=41978 RepID=UPI002E800D9B|nr:dockerin type I repeat-containing protein [Ruminococcus sp.]MEE3491679.1 dockerin type I repeat-containing protein [Ruminococcus sp.]
MKKIIAVILTACILLTAFPLIASANGDANPAALQRRVFFADYAGQFSDAYLFGMEIQNGFYLDAPYEWPGINMEAVDSNDKGDVMYAAFIPYQVNCIIINDGTSHQTVEIPIGERVLITLTGEVDDNYYYKVNVQEISYNEPDPTLSDDTTHPTIPTQADAFEKNLIVFDNHANLFDDDLMICCRSEKNAYGEESTIRAKMEPFDMNGYAEQMYRFSMPEGMTYYYLTDGKTRSQDCVFDGSVHLYGSDDKDDDGNILLYDFAWCGGVDPAFTKGPSRTLFDRFCADYVVPLIDYDAPRGGWDDTGFTDFYQLYDEMFEHHDAAGKVDWVLLHVESMTQLTVIYHELIGNRVVTKSSVSAPFDSGYGVYDVKQDRFIPLNGKSVEEYDELKKTFDELGEGKLLGDIDGDDSITIVDATLIQRCNVMLAEYPEDDEMLIPLGNIRCYSDFDRDGERDIVDATAIQRYLLGL